MATRLSSEASETVSSLTIDMEHYARMNYRARHLKEFIIKEVLIMDS